MTIEDYKAQLRVRITALRDKRRLYHCDSILYHMISSEINAFHDVLEELEDIEMDNLPKEEPRD